MLYLGTVWSESLLFDSFSFADNGLVHILLTFLATASSECSEDFFYLIFYVPSTIFQLNRDGSSWVEPVLS